MSGQEARPANKQSKHTWTHTRVTWLRVIVTSSSRSRAIIMEATARMKSPAIATCNNRQHERLDTVRSTVTSELLEPRLCTTKFHMITQHIHVFCLDLRTNSDYFTVQHWLTGFYNWQGVCLLRGTDWIFNQNNWRLVLKGWIDSALSWPCI